MCNFFYFYRKRMPRVSKKKTVEIVPDELDMSEDDLDLNEIPAPTVPSVIPPPVPVEQISIKPKRQLPEALKRANEERSRKAREKRMAESAEATRQKLDHIRARSPVAPVARVAPTPVTPAPVAPAPVAPTPVAPVGLSPSAVKKFGKKTGKSMELQMSIPSIKDAEDLSGLRYRIIQEEII
jgi:hypothetical protein